MRKLSTKFMFIHSMFLIVLSTFILLSSLHAGTISGKVIYKGAKKGAVYLRVFQSQLPAPGTEAKFQRPDIWMHDYFKLIKLTNPGDFTITDLPDAQYAIYGWMDVDDNEHVNFDPPEPIGWYSSDYGRMEPITLTQEENTQVANIILREVRPFPDRELKTEHGALKRIRGYPVLHLWGTPVEMGYAHGYLIAPQIMDFFEFFTLEDEVGSATKYKEKIIPVLKSRITLTKDLRAELDAMIQGMRDSGTDLYIEPLSREIDWIDLLAINAYGEFWMSRLACTQCAFWGKATENSELEGGLITGRNMDGECDIRKTTVIDFLIFAFEPMGKKKWISFKWPGFIGTYSGINEDGVYCMLNYGSKKPGPITVNHTPVTFIMRAILEEVGPENMVEDAVKVIDHYRSSGGGSCGAPTVMFIAAPYRGQEYPAVVYEGNRFGGKVRYPDEPPTSSPFNIVGSNHFFKFGVSPDKLGKVFGQIPYYSTQWRVTVAINKAEAWARTNKPVGTKEVINLLQSVAHGTTEHSIIFRPNEMTFDVANDDLKFDKWDAPFLKWTTFHFDEIFGKGK